MTKPLLPALPLASWLPTKQTLHLYAQIVGKIRLTLAPPRNHWWHVSLRVSPRGLTTGLLPSRGGDFEIEFDLVDHGVDVRTAAGGKARIALRDGLSVAEFHRSLFDHLDSFGIRPAIKAEPYDLSFAKKPFAADRHHAAYDAEAVAKFGEILRWTAVVLEEFAGRYKGKTSPVHFFWHAFDVALTRFSGRKSPPMPDAGELEREAYSHEVASFGFWAGDDDVRAPAFYAYAAPAPPGLRKEPLQPRAAKWRKDGSMALLMYEDVRKSADPAKSVTAFYESVFRAARERADWKSAEPRPVASEVSKR